MPRILILLRLSPLIASLFLTVLATAEWDDWTRWSDCTQTCDGGITHRTRDCLPPLANCDGERIQYKTCNNQPCMTSLSRNHSLAWQCAAYDGLERSSGVRHQWRWRGDASEACALWCEHAGQGLRIRLSKQVDDGTRCDEMSLDMCVSGKCWRIGCDHELGSSKVTDECGVCGGNGQTCRLPQAGTELPYSGYVWKPTNYSECSVSCGVGEQAHTYACVDVQSGMESENETCNGVSQPTANTRACYRHSCNMQWIADQWSACTQSCDGGTQSRDVSCVIDDLDGLVRYVTDDMCQSERPADTMTCNDHECPPMLEPVNDTLAEYGNTTSIATSGINSTVVTATSAPVTSRTTSPMIEWIGETDDDVILNVTSDDIRRKVPALAPEPVGIYDTGREGSGGDPYDVVLDPEGIANEGIAPYRDDKTENEAISDKPRFVTSDWGPCSTTCGPGIRRRRVQCKVFSARFGSVINQPSAVCKGFRPHDSSPCNIGVCQETRPEIAFTWRFTGYSECSASCRGGVQHPVFTCVGLKDYRPVLEEFCDTLSRPPMPSRQCGNVPCPPRWFEFAYGACSVSCGGGVRKRRVKCVQEAGTDDAITVVANYLCHPFPVPPNSERCNQHRCPPTWNTGDWSECSVTCGKGTQMRVVTCEQSKGSRQAAIRLSSSSCSALSMSPPTERPCTRTAGCPRKSLIPRSRRVRSRIKVDRSTYVQTTYMPAVQLTVGGRAVILVGSTVSFRCPARKFPKANIMWKRRGDTEMIPRHGRLKSRNGVLHIRRTRRKNAGVYTCVAGNTTADVRLEFHPDSDTAQEQFGERTERMQKNRAFIEAVRERRARYRVKPRRIFTLNYILAKFPKGDTPFAFYTGDWSQCSKSCGGAGIKHRRIQCELVLTDYYLIVDEEYCLRKGLMPPIESRDCGYERCPQWEVGEWSECTSRVCLRPAIGARIRSLYCVGEEELRPHAMCNMTLAPSNNQPCPRPDCYATWSTTTWTKCSRSCGGRGVQTRALRCVWITNHKFAGMHCKHLARPSIIKVCETPSCAETGCQDESSYCSLIPMLQMCDLYRTQCCLSCKFHILNGKLLQLTQSRASRPRALS